MMQFDNFVAHFFFINVILENATSPWGQSWERVVQCTSTCAYITAQLPLGNIWTFIFFVLLLRLKVFCLVFVILLMWSILEHLVSLYPHEVVIAKKYLGKQWGDNKNIFHHIVAFLRNFTYFNSFNIVCNRAVCFIIVFLKRVEMYSAN